MILSALRRPRTLGLAAIACVSLATAATATAASAPLRPGTYRGHTTQHRPVTLVARSGDSFAFRTVGWASSCRSGGAYRQSTRTVEFHLHQGRALRRISYPYHCARRGLAYTAHINLLISARQRSNTLLTGTVLGRVTLRGHTTHGPFTALCTVPPASWSARRG